MRRPSARCRARTSPDATPSRPAKPRSPPLIICQKPSSADAAPAFSPNGDSACAVPSGLTMPMPSRNTSMPPRNGRKLGLKSDTSRIAMLPVAASHQPAPDRTVEPEARRELGRQHSGGEHHHHGAREKQAKLDRREVQPFDQHARGRPKHREQSAHDQADGRGRNQEAAIGDQAEIVFGNRQRIERDPRRTDGFRRARSHRRWRRWRRRSPIKTNSERQPK